MIPEKMKTLKEFSIELEYERGKDQERADVIRVTHNEDGSIECSMYANTFDMVRTVVKNPISWVVKPDGEIINPEVIEIKLYAVHNKDNGFGAEEKIIIGAWETLDHENKEGIEDALEKFTKYAMVIATDYIKTGETKEMDMMNESRAGSGYGPKE